MIFLVSGPPGAGKTAFTTRQIERDLWRGRPVASNIVLVPDFAERIAAHRVSRLRPKLREKKAREIRARYFHLEELSDLYRVRVPKPEGIEGRWTVVLDEAGAWLGAHAWKDDQTKDMVSWFAQHRKLGADCYLIAQDVEMIAKQARLLVGQNISLVNTRSFRKWGIPIMRIVSPFRPVFVAVTTWAGAGGKLIITGRQVYKLGWWRSLYDTAQIVAGPYADVLEDSIVLPRPEGLPALPVADGDGQEEDVDALAA